MNKLWKKFYELLAGYRITYVILYLTKLGTLLFSALLPMVLSVFVDEVLYHHQTGQIAEIVLLYFILFLLSMIFSASDIIIWQYLSNYLVISIKEKLWSKILRLKLAIFNKYSQAEFAQIINDDARAFVRLINQNIMPFLNAIASTIISLVLIFSMSVYVGIIVVVTVPISVLLSKRWMKKLSALAKQERTLNVQLSTHLLDVSRRLRDIHLLSAVRFFTNKAEDANKDLLDTGKKLAVGQTLAEERVKLFEGITKIGIYIVVAFAAFAGNITIGQYIAMAMYIDNAHKAITTMLNFNFQLAQRKVNLSKIFDLLEQEEENADSGVWLKVSNGTITGSDISFGYDEDMQVFKNLSFTANRGELTGIIGQNGAGKSTLISLLLGLYTSYKGKIEIDGYDLQELSLISLRDNIDVVLQKEQLNTMSIADYIALTGKIQSKADMLKQIEAYPFCDFIVETPSLLDTPLANLSGGQAQRVRITAALLSNSPILILDEPTSMVDDQLEEEIFQILNQEKVNRTILVVTHGEKYLKNYDKLIRVGRKVESSVEAE